MVVDVVHEDAPEEVVTIFFLSESENNFILAEKIIHSL